MNDSVIIGPKEAHVWVLDPSELVETGQLSSYVAILSPAERERIQRFYFQQDRLSFTAAHSLARAALTSCVPSIAPEHWQFEATSNGRPEIANPQVGPQLRFSISHTPGLVACLVTVQVDCGIDVEMLGRTRDVAWLADGVFSEYDKARLLAAPHPARNDLFLRHWTLKEAYLKARGSGISRWMTKCTFDLDPDEIRAEFDPKLNDNASDWQFAQWLPTETHVLALAMRSGGAGRYQIILNRVPLFPRGPRASSPRPDRPCRSVDTQ